MSPLFCCNSNPDEETAEHRGACYWHSGQLPGHEESQHQGLAQANKCMTIAAIAYNLKKMLRFSPKNWISNLQRIKLAGKRLSQLIFDQSSMSLIRPGLATLPTY